MNIDKLIKICRWTALLSFVIGTIIFILYFFTSSFSVVIAGYVFVIVAVIVNAVLFVLLAKVIFTNRQQRRRILFTGLVLLVNIPVVMLYFYFTAKLTNIMRITIINKTASEINNIAITGCQTKTISKLQKGESKTVWIEIPYDCAINMNYLIEGTSRQETIEGYVTPGMGEIKEHQVR